MKSARSNGREPSRNSPTDAAVTRAESVRDRAGKRVRSKPVDGRTRPAKRWKALHEHYAGLVGPQRDQACRALASLIVQREALDLASARGDLVDPLMLVRLSGEIRRLLSRLGLDEAPVEDGTAAACAALRAGQEARA